jgi:alpha-tubulin suppressor-like RCC1 family protein
MRRSALLSPFVPVALLAAACGGASSPMSPPPTKLAFTVQPAAVASGIAISPAVSVTVQDAQGSVVTGASTSITAAVGTNPAGGTLSGTVTVGTVSGVATFSNLRLDKAGVGYTLTAAAAGLTGATSTPFNVTLPASKLAFVVQPGTTPGGFAITPAVQVAVQDSLGDTVTSASTSIVVAIGTNPQSGTLSGTSTVAAANGVATFSSLSIDNPGTGYTLTASAAGLAGVTSAAFDVSALAAVRTGQSHTCAITPGGAAYCWGYNLGGLLGTGSSALRDSLPAPVAGGYTFTALTANEGTYDTCALTSSGAAYCWGATPVAVPGGFTFAMLTAGGSTCGLTSGGAAYCWGDDTYGQLGNGQTGAFLNDSTPVAVLGGLTFTALSAGSTHTCGLTNAGTAYCWGDNRYGQLGDGQLGSFFNDSMPVAVLGGLTFTALSAGGAHTCGLTSSGAAYCWGYYGGGSSVTPVAVSGGLTFASVSAGSGHACGLTSAGSAYCWGDNSWGELGNGSTVGENAPVAVVGGLTFVSVSAGGGHSCGVTTAGVAYCWGLNRDGQLGVGSTSGPQTCHIAGPGGGLTDACSMMPLRVGTVLIVTPALTHAAETVRENGPSHSTAAGGR